MKIIIFLVSGVVFLLLGQHISMADSQDVPGKPVDQSSANYEKAKKLLPGEEVVTPTGQKLKVWSTEGPVPVSKAPEPFEDREKSVLKGGGIVIDADQIPRRHREEESNREADSNR